MRIPSGTTDQYLYFVAVDSTDFTTRETGLSSFTVYRSRNGGTATAFTTPTIAELDATNMPGVYTLLLDEDMTIGSGNDSEEMVVHITQAAMAPVTRVFELYRRAVTGGETLTVASGLGAADVTNWKGSTAPAMTGDAYARLGAPAGGSIAEDIAVVDGNVDSILVDTGTDIPAGLAAIAGYVDTEVGAIKAVTDALPDAGALTSLATAAALATVDGNVGTIITAVGTTIPALIGTPSVDLSADIAAVKAVDDAIKAVTDNLPDSGALTTLLTNVSDILTDTGTTIPGLLATIAGYIDTEVAAILADTGTDIPATLSSISSTLSTIASYIDTEVGAIKAVTDLLPDGGALTTLSGNISAILADTGTDIPATLAAIAGYIDTEVAAILADTGTDIPASLSAISSTLSTIAGYVDTEVAAIKAKTDQLSFGVAGKVDANITHVNETAVGGTGASGDEWGPA